MTERLILSRAEATALREAYSKKDVAQQVKVFRQITDNHSDFFVTLIETAYNIGDIDASCCSGVDTQKEPKGGFLIG